jgi:hypothetical protein
MRVEMEVHQLRIDAAANMTSASTQCRARTRTKGAQTPGYLMLDTPADADIAGHA